MRYEKGSFIVVPNKGSVIGVSAPAQALYMHLCDFANTEGTCYPSRALLAKRLNCSERSVDSYMKELEDIGLAIKENRIANNEKLSNLYYLPMWGGRANSALPRANSALGVEQILPIELNPVLTQPTNLMEVKLPVVVFQEREPKIPYKEIFKVFSPSLKNWMSHRGQIDAAKRLAVKPGVQKVKEIMGVYKELKENEVTYLPAINKPWDLEAKFDSLKAAMKRQRV